jgi:sortase A
MTVTQSPPDIVEVGPAEATTRRRWLPKLRDRETTVAKGSREPLPEGTVAALWVMAAASGLALWVVAFGLVFSSLFASGAQKQLYAQLREELALGTAPVGGAIEPGAPVAALSIPAIGVTKQVVVEGTTSGIMRTGPGHLRSTALPGQAGVSVIYGRAVSYGSPFRRITSLDAGDTIDVTTGQGSFTYHVDDVRRPGDPLPPALADGAGRLTLVTAESAGWSHGWTVTSTVYVDATLQQKPQPTPSGRVGAVPPAEQPMGNDTSALIPLVFWLQALLLSAIVVVWARLRWGGWQTWVVGLPLIAAVVWGVTNTAYALLPNLL